MFWLALAAMPLGERDQIVQQLIGAEHEAGCHRLARSPT